MIRLCVFDMDGLLLDSERQLYLYNGMRISRELGYPIDEAFLRSMMGNDWRIYERKTAEHMGKDFPIDRYMSLLREKIHYVTRNEAIPLRPGAKELLDFCKENGYLMAIATSTHRKDALSCLKNSGIYDYFDYIITGDEVVNGKPDPEIFLKAIAHFDVDKSEAVILEDGHNGSVAAMRGACKLIIVEDLALIEEEEKRYAILHTHDLLDVIDLLRSDREAATGV